MTLVEVLVAVSIFAAVSILIASIMETTFKAQRQAELKYDLQTFMIRLIQDIDCDKTLKVGESGALYNFYASPQVFPTNTSCGSLTVKDKTGDVIMAPNPSAQSLFVGSGAISKNWWAKAECDETNRSIKISIALRKRGTWTEFGKNPLREPKDSTDTQHYLGWTNSINPVIGGPGRPKLCEKYFQNSTLKRQSCTGTQFATGYNSTDMRCAPLPTALPSPSGECGTGQVMVHYNMRTNTADCKALTTQDLDANPTIAAWIRSQVIPTCYDGEMFMSNAISANSMACGVAYRALQCNNPSTNDYFPGSSTSCSSVSGYSSLSTSFFDFRQIQYMSNSN